MKTEAFWVGELKQENDEVLVRGRAFIDIEVGDILYIENCDKVKIFCTIIKMSTYRRNTPILNRNVTGDVYIKLSQNIKLPQNISIENSGMLYKDM